MPRRPIAVLITGLLIALFSAVSPAFAQTAAPVQIASNNSVIPADKSAAKNNAADNNNLSPEVMSAKIRSQQMEIDELREQVKKLEAMLELVTANRQAAVRAAVEPAGPPSPSPAPAPAAARTSS